MPARSGTRRQPARCLPCGRGVRSCSIAWSRSCTLLVRSRCTLFFTVFGSVTAMKHMPTGMLLWVPMTISCSRPDRIYRPGACVQNWASPAGRERGDDAMEPDRHAVSARGCSVLRTANPPVVRGRHPAGLPASAYRITVAEWQVIRPGGWTPGSGRCGWPGPARPRPVRAAPGMSGSTACGSSPRMSYGPVMRCGCVAKDVNASWSSSRSSPSVSAHPLPLGAISTTVLPLRPARRLCRWLSATAVRAVRLNASAGASSGCSGGRPAEPVSGCARGTACFAGDRCPRRAYGSAGLPGDERWFTGCLAAFVVQCLPRVDTTNRWQSGSISGTCRRQRLVEGPSALQQPQRVPR
jgi:hypothetical protein